MKDSYHNTTGAEGQLLIGYNAKAKSQEDELLAWLKLRPLQSIGASDVAARFHKWPITSIRRALTNLNKSGELVKSDRRQMGQYGRSEGMYTLRAKIFS